jgi:hypothetical protein
MQFVDVCADSILECFAALRHVAGNIPTAFVWSMEEIRHLDCKEADPQDVYVPAEIDADLVPISVNRGGNRISLVRCICADDPETQ